MPPKLLFPQNPQGERYSLDLLQALRSTTIPDTDLAANLQLYLTGYGVRRILWLYELYQQILTTPGYVLDFGTRYGNNLMLYRQFWNILEPGNVTRAFFGFDTFSGLSEPHSADGEAGCVREGNYHVPHGHQAHLEELIAIQENHNSSTPRIPRTFVVPGDASQTLKSFLQDNTQAIVALAYFDFDIYEPTKACLELLAPRLTKGSIIAFDELVVSEFPGETVALLETLGANKVRLERFPWGHCWSYLVME